MPETTCGDGDRPSYDHGKHAMLAERAPCANGFARQILETAAPFLSRPCCDLDVLDVGCGYGHTSIELARHCARVVGIEPSEALYRSARLRQQLSGCENLEFRHQGVYEFSDRLSYDLVVLDNVFEHLPDQPRALEILSRSLRPGGVLYLLVPNKLWPIEVHYKLPFLSYLPLAAANLYLRCTGRGDSYRDASYAPTHFSLTRMLQRHTELSFQYVLPARLELATAGKSLHYRIGVSLIRRFPILWTVSKALLVIAKKENRDG